MAHVLGQSGQITNSKVVLTLNTTFLYNAHEYKRLVVHDHKLWNVAIINSNKNNRKILHERIITGSAKMA